MAWDIQAWFPHSVPIFWLYPVLTITFALVPPKCVTSINAIKQTDFILSIKCRVLLFCVLRLLPSDCPKTNYKGLIGSIHSNYLPIGSWGYHSLLATEGMSDNDCQKRTLFSVNALSKCLKSIRQCFTSRHSG